MTWLSWRQQRTETIVTAALLALLAVVFVPEGIHVADLFVKQHVAHCINRQTQACSFVVGNFTLSAGTLQGLFASGWFNLVPGLIGVALAVPVLHELENGTVRLAWTQSVTRRRWLASKLGFAVGTVLLAAVSFSLLFTWYQQPFDRINGRWDQFDFEWFVPLGYALFALGLALAVGVLLRRNAAALVVAYGLYMVGRIFVESWLRKHFVAPLSTTFSQSSAGPNLSKAWVISEGPSNKAGHPFVGTPDAFQNCPKVGPAGLKHLDQACAARHGAGFTHVVYQPASRFWEFQGIETTLFGGVALLLIAFAAWRILRTD
jgi:ABC-type transport system involved in multi-copper enzyme maturation permease subunit